MKTEQETIFVRWAQDYKGLFLKVARAFAADISAQEDLIQEMMLQLWISVPTFNGQAQASTWVYRVAFNTAMVWNRQRRKHKKLQSVTLVENQIPASDNSENGELIEQLYTAIRQLPKLDASLILMSLDGLNYQKMADISGMTESNVGVKLNRAKKQLAQKMKGLSNEF